MSYCVHCGVELDPTAGVCPLCGTPVHDPAQGVDHVSPKPYPTRFAVVEPPAKSELALLLSAMLVSASAVCALLNLFLSPGRLWSVYVIGGAITLWLWAVPPLLFPRMPGWIRVLADGAAVGVYVYLISLDLGGTSWYLALALPMVLVGTALGLGLAFLLPRRSILTSVTLCVAAAGVLCLAIELFVDLYLTGAWRPGWSLVAAAGAAALGIPLVVVRRVPGLREWARRKFHL